jgi:hypothetical protein
MLPEGGAACSRPSSAACSLRGTRRDAGRCNRGTPHGSRPQKNPASHVSGSRTRVALGALIPRHHLAGDRPGLSCAIDEGPQIGWLSDLRQRARPMTRLRRHRTFPRSPRNGEVRAVVASQSRGRAAGQLSRVPGAGRRRRVRELPVPVATPSPNRRSDTGFVWRSRKLIAIHCPINDDFGSADWRPER